jgi:hypothetical protein
MRACPLSLRGALGRFPDMAFSQDDGPNHRPGRRRDMAMARKTTILTSA